jgi:hypothetical protein
MNLRENQNMRPDGLLGWIPFAIRWEDSGPVIDWFHIGGRRFVEPFFDQTIQRHKQDPDYQNRFRVTPAEALNDLEQSSSALAPAGFVFHAARCGSTLVAQVLAAVPSIRVLSEPNILTSFLTRARRENTCTDEKSVRLLHGIIGALGRSQNSEERHYVIKFDSAAILAMPLIRLAFPNVPWTFVYREPLEILGAQLRGQGHTLPPGLANAGLVEGDPVDLSRMQPEEFWTRALASRFASALEAVSIGNALLLNYRQLPEAAWDFLLPFFGLSCSQENRTRMQAIAKLDAKNPSRTFSKDSREKTGATSSTLSALVDSFVMGHYNRLESIRTESYDHRANHRSTR